MAEQEGLAGDFMKHDDAQSITVRMPGPEEVEGAGAMAEQAGSYLVESDPAYTYAGEMVVSLRSRQKELEDRRMAMTRPLDATKRQIMDFFATPIGRLAQVERGLLAKMTNYRTAKERAAQAEQRRLNEIAEQKRARLEERAGDAEAKGKLEHAAKLDRQAQEVQAPVVEAAIPKARGVSIRKVYTFEILDESKLADEFWQPNLNEIGVVVRSLRMKADAFFKGAIKVIESDGTIIRTKRE